MIAAASLSLAADVPYLINYQGYLEQSGSAANGTFPVKLSLYDAETGGTAGLSITNTAAIAALDQEDGDADGNSAVVAITPREKIGSVFLFQ